MKVVIIKNDPKLGSIGEVKNVADGYAQNFLIPRKMVLPATQANVALAEKIKKDKQEAKGSTGFSSKQFVGQLKGYTLTLKEKADENGTFFAGITKNKIAQELCKKGLKVNAKKILLAEPIKKPGNYQVEIDFGEKKAEISVNAVVK